jgi:hypothetical protein
MSGHWSEERLEALAYIRDQQILGVLTGDSTPSAGILSAITEPLGLPGTSLPAYGIAEAGSCRDCLRPPVHSGGLCVYCCELADRAAGAHLPHRNPLQAAVIAALLMYGVVALLWSLGVIA